MLFSMWNLYNSLTLDGVTPEASIISGKAEMGGFRLGQTGEKNMGSLTELPAGPTLRFGGDYITLPGFTLEEAANTLSKLLDSYAPGSARVSMPSSTAGPCRNSCRWRIRSSAGPCSS